MPLKALLIDDDPDMPVLVGAWFKARGQTLAVCDQGSKALAAARKAKPDVILLDVFLGDTDGFKVCTALKADPGLRDIPVIMVSGLDREATTIARGLNTGADDYLLKELNEDLLFAKIAAVLRRKLPPKEFLRDIAGMGLSLDVDARTVELDGRPVALTRKEFDLLAALLRAKGRTVTAKDLLERVWGYDTRTYDDPHTVRVHVYSLKSKLGPAFAERMETVTGVGYRLR